MHLPEKGMSWLNRGGYVSQVDGEVGVSHKEGDVRHLEERGGSPHRKGRLVLATQREGWC